MQESDWFVSSVQRYVCCHYYNQNTLLFVFEYHRIFQFCSNIDWCTLSFVANFCWAGEEYQKYLLGGIHYCTTYSTITKLPLWVIYSCKIQAYYNTSTNNNDLLPYLLLLNFYYTTLLMRKMHKNTHQHHTDDMMYACVVRCLHNLSWWLYCIS